ncbi:Shedu anti-phage system protein SduA domain-containing protein [Paenibacillus sp. FSL M7-1046]|uniref:Shedu anti-phage system protein SduA domain-containing protein n=1 Tax=Paenibacillus sp. FSL M7-1046 TaxID=2975315 RepID=UPI0030F6F652
MDGYEFAESTYSYIQNTYGQILFSLMKDFNLKNIPAFLFNPDEVRFYLGRDHLAIEYIGPYDRQILDEWKTEIKYYDFTETNDFLEEIVGFPTGREDPPVSLNTHSDNTYYATPEATSILVENNWNFLAQDMIFILNSPKLVLTNQHTRLRNCYFYSVVNTQLKVRNIKWMEFLPLTREDVNEAEEKINMVLFDPESTAFSDAQYIIPERLSFQHSKLSIINRFIELYNSDEVIEVMITQFLAQPEHHFILKMAFFGVEVFDERECVWAEGTSPAIRPDFFVSHANGYADIVEFKLPYLKTEQATVGRVNRESFSAELNSHISQTRTYRQYFEDPRNCRYVKDTYGINVYYPKRYLVIGRRLMFSSEVWRAIEADYNNISILTYDDIIDTVMGHLLV